MKNGNRPRVNQRRGNPIRSARPRLEAGDDEQFFARHPTRFFRVRPLSQDEIQVIQCAGSELELPSCGMKWIAVVWQRLPDTKLKVIFQAPKDMKTDLSEACCRFLYFDLTSPEKIALSDKFEALVFDEGNLSGGSGGRN
jgi:hypothetical protein